MSRQSNQLSKIGILRLLLGEEFFSKIDDELEKEIDRTEPGSKEFGNIDMFPLDYVASILVSSHPFSAKLFQGIIIKLDKIMSKLTISSDINSDLRNNIKKLINKKIETIKEINKLQKVDPSVRANFVTSTVDVSDIDDARVEDIINKINIEVEGIDRQIVALCTEDINAGNITEEEIIEESDIACMNVLNTESFIRKSNDFTDIYSQIKESLNKDVPASESNLHTILNTIYDLAAHSDPSWEHKFIDCMLELYRPIDSEGIAKLICDTIASNKVSPVASAFYIKLLINNLSESFDIHSLIAKSFLTKCFDSELIDQTSCFLSGESNEFMNALSKDHDASLKMKAVSHRLGTTEESSALQQVAQEFGYGKNATYRYHSTVAPVTVDIEQEGALDFQTSSWLIEDIENLQKSAVKFKSPYTNDSLEKMKEMLAMMPPTLRDQNAQKDRFRSNLFKKYISGEPILIPSGCNDHSISIIAWGNYLAITNRGIGGSSKGGTVIIKLDSPLSRDDIQNLFYPDDNSMHSTNKVISNLGGGSSTVMQYFSNWASEYVPDKGAYLLGLNYTNGINNELAILDQKPQKYGTCSYVNKKGALQAFMLLVDVMSKSYPNKSLVEILGPKEAGTDSFVFNRSDIDRERALFAKSMDDAKTDYKTATALFRDNSVASLLKQLLLTSSADDKLISEADRANRNEIAERLINYIELHHDQKSHSSILNREIERSRHIYMSLISMGYKVDISDKSRSAIDADTIDAWFSKYHNIKFMLDDDAANDLKHVFCYTKLAGKKSEQEGEKLLHSLKNLMNSIKVYSDSDASMERYKGLIIYLELIRLNPVYTDPIKKELDVLNRIGVDLINSSHIEDENSYPPHPPLKSALAASDPDKPIIDSGRRKMLFGSSVLQSLQNTSAVEGDNKIESTKSKYKMDNKR
jgi:DNA-binding phage protein